MQRIHIAADGPDLDGDTIELLLAAVSERGLKAACELIGMPHRRVVLAWARRSPEFRSALEDAECDYARLLLGEAIECADSAEDRESASCARIKVDTRLKVAAMLAPAVYGRDRGGVDVGGVVVQLVRLAAQGVRDQRLLEAEALTPHTATLDVYRGGPSAENREPDGNGPHRAGGGCDSSRDHAAGGSPATGGAPISPPPTNTPGPLPEKSYTKISGDTMKSTQVARDRLVITVPDEADIFDEAAPALDGALGEGPRPALDLDEPVPA